MTALTELTERTELTVIIVILLNWKSLLISDNLKVRDASASKNLSQFLGPCESFAKPGSGPLGIGDGCRIQLKINPDDEVNCKTS